MRQQGKERLELEKNFFLLHCNHQNVIPHYSGPLSSVWHRGTITGYWCCVCQYKLEPAELLAIYERTKREREAIWGEEDTPADEEVSEWGPHQE